MNFWREWKESRGLRIYFYVLGGLALLAYVDRVADTGDKNLFRFVYWLLLPDRPYDI